MGVFVKNIEFAAPYIGGIQYSCYINSRLIFDLVPFKDDLIQWLGNTYQADDGTYWQKDKSSTRTDEPEEGGYLDFNGTDNCLAGTCTYDPDYIEFEVYLHNFVLTAGDAFFTKGVGGTNSEICCDVGAGAYIRLFFYDSSDIAYAYQSTSTYTVLNDGKNHTLKGVYIKTSETTSTLQLYVDGVLIDSANVNSVAKNNYNTYSFGCRGTGAYLKSGIQNCKINSDSENIVWLPCDEKSGTTCFDVSGNENHSTIGGTTTAVRATDNTLPSYNNIYGKNDGGTDQTELVTNGDFSSDTDWIFTDNAYIEDGVGVLGAYITEPSRLKQIILTSGKQYKVEFDIVEYDAGTAKDFRVYLNSNNISGSLTTTGHYSFIGTANGATLQFYNNSTSSNVTIDNVSVKEYYPEEVKIPASQANANLDAIGNTLLNKGKAPYPIQLTDSGCLYMNGINNYIPTGIQAQSDGHIFYFKSILHSVSSEDILGAGGGYVNDVLYMIYRSVVRIHLWNSNGTLFSKDGTTILSDGDLINLKVVHDSTAKTVTAYLDDVEECSFTYTGDWTPTTNYLLLTRCTGITSANCTLLYSKLENSSDEYSFEYTFGETSGTTVYNKLNNTHGTINGTTTAVHSISDYQEPYNLNNGFDLWQNDSTSAYLRVPFDKDGNSIKTDGDTITGYTWISRNPGSLYGHNGAETAYQQQAFYDLMQIDGYHATNLWYDTDGVTPIPFYYDDITFDREELHYVFADVISKSPLKFNYLSYYTQKTTDEELIKIYKFLKSIETVTTTDGDLETSDGIAYVLKDGVK